MTEHEPSGSADHLPRMASATRHAFRSAVVRASGVGALIITAACARDAGAGSDWEARIDTVGDTITVRTISGGEWGPNAELVPELRIGKVDGADEYLLGSIVGLAVDREGNMFVFDRQVPALREYAPDGSFVRTFGRSGGGPGEYNQSDGGLAILRDGRIVLRDPGNARFQLWSADGEPAGEWMYSGGFFTSRPLYVDTADNVYSSSNAATGPYAGSTILVKYRPDGQRADTLLAPTWNHEAPVIRAGTEHLQMVMGVPFSASEDWTFSPLGYFVGGVSTDYNVDVLRPDGSVLRIGRVIEPVPVQPAEKANSQALTTQNVQRMVPGWRWNGAAIPDTKPPFRAVLVAEDGRIWVQLSQPGQPIPEDQRDDPVGPDGSRRVVDEWSEPIAFDVFQPDGRYVGMVRAPDGLGIYPRPVIRGDTMWAIMEDDLGVEQITRLTVRVTPPDGTR